MLNFQQLSSSILLTGATFVLISQSAWADVVEITKVDLKPTDNGIEIILVTTNSESLQVILPYQGVGNTNKYVAQIPNMQLNLPDKPTFREDNPTANIDYIAIRPDSRNENVQIVVSLSTGTITPPKIKPESGRLILSFNIAETTVSAPSSDSTQASESEQAPSTTEPSTVAPSKPEDSQPTTDDQKTDREQPSTPSGAELILGNWLAEDTSIQPRGFIFEKNNKLIVVYQSYSGAFTIEGEYSIREKIGDYTAIDLIINNRTIETIFQIVDNNQGGKVLSMELMGLKKDEDRPTEITPKRERKFNNIQDRSGLYIN